MSGETASGVKPRLFNQGCEFGDIHRLLPAKCGMFDVDRIEGQITLDLTLRKKDEMFIEYRTDFVNNTCRFIAMFEIKYKWGAMADAALEVRVGTATFAQREMCKKLGCRYFFVVATDGRQPFEFFEIADESIENRGILDYGQEVSEKEQAICAFWRDNLGIR